EVVSIFHFEATLLAWLGATQILGEFRNRVCAANLHHHLVHFHRFGVRLAILGRTFETDDGKVPVGQRTLLLLYRAVSRLPLPQIIKGALDLVLSYLRWQLLDANVVVGGDLELRQYLEARLKPQGLA